jgi:AraC-like DNA-binding protein
MDLAVEEEAIALVEAAIASAYRIRGLRTGPKKGSSRRAHADWATAAKLVLAARFAESLSLDELATAVHVSPYHLCRVFRQQTGLSIRTYRQQLRQRAALQRLAETNDDLTRIALGLGFTDHSHFTHCFSSAFGISPSAFRRSAAMPLIREMSKNLQVG